MTARRLVVGLILALSLTAIGHKNASAAGHRSQMTSCIFNTTVLASPPNTCRPHALVYPAKVRGTVKRAIYDGALTFGVPYTTLLVIAKCESGLNVHAANSGHLGLFQFAQATFQGGAKAMKKMTGVLAKSVWGPRDASYVAAFMFATGRDTSWTCLSQIRSVNAHFLAFQGRLHGEALP